MSVISLSQADRVYRCTEIARVDRHSVRSAELERYVRVLTSLKISLGDLRDDDLWQEVLSRAFRFQYQVCSAPLPFNHPAIGARETAAELSDTLGRACQAYPEQAPLAQMLIEKLEVLSALHGNPLLSYIAELLDFESGEGTAVVLNRTRFIAPVQAVLESNLALCDLSVVSENQATALPAFDRLLVIGAGHWYREGLLAAPRAPRIDVIRYGFIRDYWRPEPAFATQRAESKWRPSVSGEEGTIVPESEQVEVGPFAIDAQQILGRVGAQAPILQHERVDARLILLAGDGAVLLDADDESWAMVIDLEAEEGSRVRRVSTSKIEAGMYLLLRTEGGGDYIVPVADGILGDRAASARKVQAFWKDRLRKRVEMLGLSRVARDLRELGAKRANEQNVRNWISERMIRTQDYWDFHGILQYTHLDARAAEIWKLMGDILNAHKKAGQKIRNLLLEQVAVADLRILQIHGMMDFELPGEDSGTLTAYRVEEIAPGTVTVGHGDLGRVFDSRSGSWRE